LSSRDHGCKYRRERNKEAKGREKERRGTVSSEFDGLEKDASAEAAPWVRRTVGEGEKKKQEIGPRFEMGAGTAPKSREFSPDCRKSPLGGLRERKRGGTL